VEQPPSTDAVPHTPGSDGYLLNSVHGKSLGYSLSLFFEFKNSKSFASPSFLSPLEPHSFRQLDFLPGV
jgi:hypothetical protein